MKNMQHVIQEVVRRSGHSEDIVEKILRSAETDCREFLAEKKGYSLWWPNLGTFVFRVSFITKYIQIQRFQLAYWKYRLSVGKLKNNSRTIIASQANIDQRTFRIKRALLIKQEYLNEHCKYNKQADQYRKRTAVSDISRLDELLNVEAIIADFAEKYNGKEGHLPEVPGKRPIQSLEINHTEVQ